MKLLGIVAVLMLSTNVSAIGMGGINVVSALGQPLKADIELVAISKAEKDSLVARLASPEAYKSAGLEYPYGNKYKFQIESRADGQPYIKVSSAQPVNDPFVSLLVELTWSSGKLSREYTFLLDPPGYVPEQPVQTNVQTVAPAVAVPPAMPNETVTPLEQAAPAEAAPAETAAKPVEQAAPAETVPPVEQAAPAETAVTPVEQAAPAEISAKPEEQAAPAKAVAKPEEQAAPMETTVKPTEQAAPEVTAVQAKKEKLVVQKGDTMYKIAEQYKPTDMSLERVLVAIYRVNADQFDDRNMNRIQTGKILRLPSEQEMMSVSLPEAVKEIHAQAADWNAYRQKLASAAPVSKQEQAAQQVATGKISSSIADMAPVAKESAKEVLKLSKGEAPGDKVGTGAGGKPMSEKDKAISAQEDAIAKNKALKEGEKRNALLEKNLNDMQRLAQLKAESAALAQPATKAAVSEVTATSAVKPTTVVQPKPKQVKPEPSLLDQIMEDPLYRAGGAAAVLVLAGLGYMLSRRRKNPSHLDKFQPQPFEDVGDITGRIAAPVLPSPETGDFTISVPAQAVAESQSENVDPISEADLFLNFGRDVQAEEILKEALQSTPSNHQIHLKLLGIYANRKDTDSFSTIARQLQDSGDADAWQQAVAMGRKLEPNNPMYGGAGTKEEVGSATVQMTAFNATPEPENVPKAQVSALDFDFDVSASKAKAAPTPEQDFLSGAEKTMILSPDGSMAAQGEKMDFDVTSTKTAMHVATGQEGAMDFDVTSTNPSMRAAGEPTEAASPVSDDMVFDITGSQSFKSAAAPAEISKPAQADDGGMAFTLDFPVENKASAPVAQPAEVSLAGISLNFDDAVAAPSEPAVGGKDDHWQEVATKLDLAKAYHEMGDASGAREILEEVLREGDAEQRGTAKTLLEQLG
jgi:pilus assembly protein FimV